MIGDTLLQVYVTTDEQECRPVARMRCDVVAKLPAESGAAVKVGRLRKLTKRSGVDLEGAEDELVMKCLFHLITGPFNVPLT